MSGSGSGRLANALQVGPPDTDAAAAPFAVRGGLLGEYFGEVLVGEEEVGHGNGVVGYGAVSLGVIINIIIWIIILDLIPSGGGGSGAGVGREGHEEVNLTTLELGLRWDDDDLGESGGGVVVGGGGGGAGPLEDVFGVGFHDVAGLDGATDFFHVAIGVDYANHIQSSTW